MKPVFPTSAHYYLPGAKSGGPVRTIAVLVDRQGDEFDFRIGDLDRDAIEAAPYPEIRGNAWNEAGKSRMGRLEPTETGTIRWP
jgi:hypothetical protein